MFYALTSSASALVNVVTNDLVPEYVASIGEGICSKVEDQPGIPRWRTRNPSFVSPLREQEKYTHRSIIPGRTAWVMRTMASTLIVTMSSFSLVHAMGSRSWDFLFAIWEFRVDPQPWSRFPRLCLRHTRASKYSSPRSPAHLRKKSRRRT